MAFTNSEDQKAYSHKWYSEHSEAVNRRAIKRLTEVRKQNHEEMSSYLRAHPCVSCGESDPVVLEFHHIDPKSKHRSIAQLVSSSRWEKVLTEIEKCEVRCANCHKRETAKQFGWWRSNAVFNHNSVAYSAIAQSDVQID